MTTHGEERRPGEIVGGKYRLVRFLAAGGMGAVYEAQHTVVKRRFAVKFLHPELAEKRESLARFQREAQAAGALESEHLAAALDFGVASDGAPFIVMEYLEGESLDKLLAREGRLSLERASDLVAQSCRGIQAAHAAGIVHRDLKPQNLFLSRREDGTDLVKVLDFGVAKLEAADRGDAATETGTVLGTPAYMAPEQARGEKTIDHRADVYALGAILYELVSGRKPHPGDSHNAILHHIATQPAVPLDFVDPALPATLVQATERALSSEPAARFASAEHFVKAIAAFAERKVWPAPERTASNPVQDAVEPTELAAPAVARAREATVELAGAAPSDTSARRVPKLAFVALAAAGALLAWLATRSSGEPSALPVTSEERTPRTAAAPPVVEINGAEAPLPVTVQTTPVPAPSFDTPLERGSAGTSRASQKQTEPARPTPQKPAAAPAPVPAASAPSLAFDRRNPYD